MNWIFQGNPRVFPVLEHLRTGEPIENWSVTHSLTKLQPNDRAALWVSGPRAGIYALGTVAGVPEENTSSDGWIDPDDRGVLRWFCSLALNEILYESPILRINLLADPRFHHASIVRHPWTGSPFPITDLEWKVIEDQRSQAAPGKKIVPPQPKKRATRRKTEEWSPRAIPPAVKLEVWKRDRGRCVICRSRVTLQFDHVIPWSKGGSSLTAANVQILCAKHNSQKRARIE